MQVTARFYWGCPTRFHRAGNFSRLFEMPFAAFQQGFILLATYGKMEQDMISIGNVTNGGTIYKHDKNKTAKTTGRDNQA